MASKPSRLFNIRGYEPVPVVPALKQYSGQFNVRIAKRIHRNLAIKAAQAGVSLNALVTQKLSQNQQQHP